MKSDFYREKEDTLRRQQYGLCTRTQSFSFDLADLIPGMCAEVFCFQRPANGNKSASGCSAFVKIVVNEKGEEPLNGDADSEVDRAGLKTHPNLWKNLVRTRS